MKKWFALCLSCALLILPFGGMSAAVSAFESDFTYTVSANAEAIAEGYLGVATITGCTSYQSKLVIPSSIDNFKVTAIADNAFTDYAITELVLPDTLISIGAQAFYNCSSLTSVTVPGSVTTLSHGAFGRCRSLETVVLSEGVELLQDSVFSNCSSLTEITVPSTLTSVTWGAFLNCSAIKKVHITDLQAWCYINFQNFTSNPLAYGAGLYWNDELITKLTVPEGTRYIGDHAFEQYAYLSSVALPDSVKEIGTYAFSECELLESVRSEGGLTTIDSFAFSSCSALTTVTLPAALTSVGWNAFNYAPIETIYYGGDEAAWNAIEVAEYNDPLLAATVQYNSNGPAYTLGDVTMDGVVDMFDALALYISVSGAGMLSVEQQAYADLNQDAAIDMFDALALYSIVSGQ